MITESSKVKPGRLSTIGSVFLEQEVMHVSRTTKNNAGIKVFIAGIDDNSIR